MSSAPAAPVFSRDPALGADARPSRPRRRAGLGIWEVFAATVTPWVAGYPLQPPELVKAVFAHQLGVTISDPLAALLHGLTGLCSTTDRLSAVRPSAAGLERLAAGWAWGVITYFIALAVFAPLGGQPFFCTTSRPLSFMSLVGHAIYGFVAARRVRAPRDGVVTARAAPRARDARIDHAARADHADHLHRPCAGKRWSRTSRPMMGFSSGGSLRAVLGARRRDRLRPVFLERGWGGGDACGSGRRIASSGWRRSCASSASPRCCSRPRRKGSAGRRNRGSLRPRMGGRRPVDAIAGLMRSRLRSGLFRHPAALHRGPRARADRGLRSRADRRPRARPVRARCGSSCRSRRSTSRPIRSVAAGRGFFDPLAWQFLFFIG